MKILGAILIFTSLNLLGCTHALHHYHAGELRPKVAGKKYIRIKSLGEQTAVLGFVTETNYVNEAWQKLLSQCSAGDITGIHTRYSTSHGFLSWKNQVQMTGYCVQ
jgi:hypothetical protein